WSEPVETKSGPAQRLGTATAGPGGLGPSSFSNAFPADGAGFVLYAPARFPTPGAGFFLNGWLMGGETHLCAWFDGAGKLGVHSGKVALGRSPLRCPTGPSAALADGSVIGTLAQFGQD